MRLVLYNIRYGTGGRPWSGYWHRTSRNLAEICRFLESLAPDVVGLIEVDAGSYRSGGRHQGEVIAGTLGHACQYRTKYHRPLWLRRVPVLNRQGNALLCRDRRRTQRFHYLQTGMKRLVLELELPQLTIFLVHLSLRRKVRTRQLAELRELVRDQVRPHIVAGDFNLLRGKHEIHPFLAATGLATANTGSLPSFPSWAPKRHLDLVLCSPEIRVEQFRVPRVRHSDHLPLVCDFRIDGNGTVVETAC